MAKSSQIRLLNRPVALAYSATPQVVGIAITGRCMLRCRHCFNHSGIDNVQELPLATIEQLLDKMVEWSVDQIRLSGGEPTYHRNFRAIVAACQARQIRIGLNSHGVYSTSVLSYLRDAPVDLFIISVDGLAQANDAIRGEGTFERAIRSCRELHAADQQVMIGCHLGLANRNNVAGLIAVAAEIGIDIKFSPIRPIGRAVENMSENLLDPSTYLEIVSEITSLRKRYPHIHVLTDFDILDESLTDVCRRVPDKVSCKAGRTMININYDGGIYPCAFFVTPEGEFCAGNIYHDDIETVWRNAPVFQSFRTHQKSQTCLACEHYRVSCVGGCPAVAYLVDGYLDAHDPFCFAHLI